MEPLLTKTERGWRCGPCKLDIYGRQDAETHGRYPPHSIPADFFASDPEGNYYDTRKVDLPALLRSGGLA